MSDRHCLNCGAHLEGPYCYACGQPVKGMIRQFRSVIGDALDTVFEYDSRIWRTLLPLYFQPGRVTLDFIAGRRIRFVTPFRLAFVLLVLALLVLQLTVTGEMPDDGEPGIFDADTVAEVEALRDEALTDLADARQEVGEDGARARALAQAERAVRDEAARRIEWIEAVAAARAAGQEAPPEPAPRPTFYFNDDPWDATANPLVIDWLPDVVTSTLNRWLQRAVDNLERAQQDPDRFFDAFLGLLPVALFALLPIFALLLKLFHAFTGRLYMEHMVVALHSHAFFGLALMVSALLDWLAQALAAAPVLEVPVALLHALSLVWIPVYALLMQRRVYAQGWLLTVIKFVAIGTIHLLLLVLALTAAALITLIRG